MGNPKHRAPVLILVMEQAIEQGGLSGYFISTDATSYGTVFLAACLDGGSA
jgi:hypothetical protein